MTDYAISSYNYNNYLVDMISNFIENDKTEQNDNTECSKECSQKVTISTSSSISLITSLVMSSSIDSNVKSKSFCSYSDIVLFLYYIVNDIFMVYR